ncbi:MAG TPA: AraC family transcriptional regulator [Gaiellaceae bacterium]
MPETLRGVDAGRLERSCTHQDSIRFGPCATGIERAEVRLVTLAFEPHRHDTYAIGITTAGVQTFGYRGSRRICLPGQVHVLHPDETHDGEAGTEAGFSYRILYIAPELVRQALGGRTLPFVSAPVPAPSAASSTIAALLADIDEPLDETACADVTAAVADSLLELGHRGPSRPSTLDRAAIERVREHLAETAREQTTAATLEAIAGTDRFTIARHFRWAYGTSPNRYRTLRRLELARDAISAGVPLARAAAEAGFADQSHLTRQFKRAYGLTPARWAAVSATPGSRRAESTSHES